MRRKVLKLLGLELLLGLIVGIVSDIASSWDMRSLRRLHRRLVIWLARYDDVPSHDPHLEVYLVEDGESEDMRALRTLGEEAYQHL